MIIKTKNPYIRDVYLAYLIIGAKLTEIDGFPIIEPWMVAKSPPKEMHQWDRRKDAINSKECGINFYCVDRNLNGVLNNPKGYVHKLRKFNCVVGMDASPYDNMPLVVQKSQIYCNLAITYYFGLCGLKIIPNVRLGNNDTVSSLDAYPKHTLISIGTSGCVKLKSNQLLFAEQLKLVVDKLRPKGMCVYGPMPDLIFDYVRKQNIPIYQYASYSMKENKRLRNEGGKPNER